MNLAIETTDVAEALLKSYQLLEQQIAELEKASGITSRADQLENVKRDLEAIKPQEQQLGQLRDALVQNSIEVPAAAQLAINAAIKIVSRLLPKISDIEKATKEDRLKLVPKIRSSVLGLEMQSAYQRNQ